MLLNYPLWYAVPCCIFNERNYVKPSDHVLLVSFHISNWFLFIILLSPSDFVLSCLLSNNFWIILCTVKIIFIYERLKAHQLNAVIFSSGTALQWLPRPFISFCSVSICHFRLCFHPLICSCWIVLCDPMILRSDIFDHSEEISIAIMLTEAHYEFFFFFQLFFVRQVHSVHD